MSTIEEKAAAIGFYLIKGHYFFDGNKRTGFAAMATFLKLNGYSMDVDWIEGEGMIGRLADGGLSRDHWTNWVQSHTSPE